MISPEMSILIKRRLPAFNDDTMLQDCLPRPVDMLSLIVHVVFAAVRDYCASNGVKNAD